MPFGTVEDTFRAALKDSKMDAADITDVNRMSSGGDSRATPQLTFDNLLVTIPEPDSMSLLALGGVLMLRRRR